MKSLLRWCSTVLFRGIEVRELRVVATGLRLRSALNLGSEKSGAVLLGIAFLKTLPKIYY